MSDLDGQAALAARVHRRLVASAVAGEPLAAQAARIAREEAPLLPEADLRRVVSDVLAVAEGLGPLEPLLADPAVTDVCVNGPDQVWVERAGILERVPVELDADAIFHLIERVVGPLGLRADRASPLVDARLPDGSRVNAVVPPLAVDGPCLTIRRFGARAIPLEAFCPPAVAMLLAGAVRSRANIVISGGTGAGKTTLLNALAGAIPASERVITIEDTAELRLAREHVVRLEARPANADGVGAVRVRDLVRNALRMRPDRIVVGEVRGPEALDMLQAMNTGHEGSLSTCHANGTADALRRLETMALTSEVALTLEAVREQVAAAVDLVVQVARRPGGGRAVVEVAEVVPDRQPGCPVAVRRLADERGVLAGPLRPLRDGGLV